MFSVCVCFGDSCAQNFKVHGSQQHTHTLNKSNPFYISKTKLRQFSEHILTHVKPCNGQITLYLHMYQELQRILRVVCEKHRKIA